MDKSFYEFLDIFFIIFHTFLIVFNLFGWVWIKTRKLNFISLLTVAFSWIILGIWYGIGYCPLTEWHWQIKVYLGQTDLPYSYIKYLVDLYLNVDSDPVIVDYLTAILFICALFISGYLNIIGKFKK